jgi:hypothetical protein
MPPNAPALPVRFQFGPSATPTLRTQKLTIGAMGAASAPPSHTTHENAQGKKQ